MDILTEIYRIKQVMGLITEQNDKSLVDENVYEAIKNIESKFSFTDENGNIKGETYTGKEKESNIKKVIADTIGLDYWFRIKPKLRGQIYSFMYQADSSENSLYRWLAGLAQSIDPNIERKNVFADKVPKRDANGNIMLDKYGKHIMEILPRDKLADDKKSNINKAIDTVKKAIDNDKINYLNYFNIVKDQYDKLKGTTNDEQNKIKIWAPRPEALDKLMSGESWPYVKAWWYNEIGETEPITQVNNASTQKDSIPANPAPATPTSPVSSSNVLPQDSLSTNVSVVAPSNGLQQDLPPIDSELNRLETSGITDTGVVAPFTDKPYISSGNTIYNQRKQSSNLQSNPKLRRPWGDPYIYYSATTGDIYYHLCGKIKDQPGMPVVPCPKIPSDKWIKSDSSNRTNAIKQKIFQSTTPNIEPEETAPTSEIIRRNVLNKFRNLFYSTYLSVIASENLADVKKWPVKPTYKGQLDILDDTYDVNLVGVVSSTPTKITVGAQLFTKIMDNFITKQVDVGGVKYELKDYNSDAILPASSIFKRDSTGYVGDIKAENEIKSEKLGIYKVE